MAINILPGTRNSDNRYLLSKVDGCTWRAEIPLQNVYRWTPDGLGGSTVTCEASSGDAAIIQLRGEFDTVNKITTFTYSLGIPWKGTGSGGEAGNMEFMTVKWKDEITSCFLPGNDTNTPFCDEIIFVSIDITGNAGYSDNPGIFNSSYWVESNWCDIIQVVLSLQYAADPESCYKLGACCLPDGTCREDMEQGDCLTLGGKWYINRKCSSTDFQGRPNDGILCGAPRTRGCCLPDGTCIDASEFDCISRGGVVQFDSCANTTCGGATGKCCLPDGTCRVVTSAECTSLSGTYGGDGTDCFDGCASDPTGACCSPIDQCSVTTEVACIASGGTYQGDGTTCSPNPCVSEGCQNCEDGSDDPSSVTVILGGFRSNADAFCDCADFNGTFVLNQDDEDDCLYKLAQTCPSGGAQEFRARCIGTVGGGGDIFWQLEVDYAGSPLIPNQFFKVKCSGGVEAGRRVRPSGPLCVTTNSASIDFIVNGA